MLFCQFIQCYTIIIIIILLLLLLLLLLLIEQNLPKEKSSSILYLSHKCLVAHLLFHRESIMSISNAGSISSFHVQKLFFWLANDSIQKPSQVSMSSFVATSIRFCSVHYYRTKPLHRVYLTKDDLYQVSVLAQSYRYNLEKYKGPLILNDQTSTIGNYF